jgi:hypothetical protein
LSSTGLWRCGGCYLTAGNWCDIGTECGIGYKADSYGICVAKDCRMR